MELTRHDSARIFQVWLKEHFPGCDAGITDLSDIPPAPIHQDDPSWTICDLAALLQPHVCEDTASYPDQTTLLTSTQVRDCGGSACAAFKTINATCNAAATD